MTDRETLEAETQGGSFCACLFTTLPNGSMKLDGNMFFYIYSQSRGFALITTDGF
jgi:hypothetical protein